MNNIILSSVTREELVNEISKVVLSGITTILKESRKEDLNSKEWLSSKETESLLKISSVTRWNWSKSGILKANKIGNRLRYRKDDVLKALIRKEPEM